MFNVDILYQWRHPYRDEICQKLWESFTAGKNFTLPPAVTAVTNITSAGSSSIRNSLLHILDLFSIKLKRKNCIIIFRKWEGSKAVFELFRKFIRFSGATRPLCDYWYLVEVGFDKEGKGNATALCPSSSYSPARQRCFREIHQRASNQDLKYCANDWRQFWR